MPLIVLSARNTDAYEQASPVIPLGNTMAKRLIVFILVLIVMIAAATYAYSRWRTDRRLNGGEIVDETGSVTTPAGTAPVATPSRSETEATAKADNDSKSTFPSAQPARPGMQVYPAALTAPATDSLPANPPNRAVFAGSGRFQVYRQGDLTWRVNTETGSPCILFATNEQWRKPVVYRNGCGNS